MTTTVHASVIPGMKGRLVGPADPAWDDAREAFNTRLDVRPAAVAFPVDAADVVAIIRHARRHGLRVAPQATAHNAGPLLDALEDTIIVNVREIGGVSIDEAALRVRVGAGVKWERVTPGLSELGLAGLHGSSPDVGIAGYSLGGGIGWLARRHGMQTNAVTAIELVTADGRLVRADPEHEPDLFWALRGGGGNFGVVTAIEFRVMPLRELYAGALFFPFARAGDVLRAWARLLPDLPDDLMTWANLAHFPDLPMVPEAVRGRSFAIVMGAHLGGEDEGRRLLAPLRALAPVMDTFAMGPPAALAELAMDPPDPLPFELGHALLAELPADAVERLLEAAGPGSGAGTALTMLQLRHMGGALGRPPDGAGARATLPGEVLLVALGVAPDDATGRAVEGILERVLAAVAPLRVGHYPNFVEVPADASAFFDTATWTRLRAVKAAYDPDDLFRGNHHVPPGDAAGGAVPPREG